MRYPHNSIVQVFVRRTDGTLLLAAQDLDRKKLLNLCATACNHLQRSSILTLYEPGVESCAVIQVCAWIQAYDFDKPKEDQYLTLGNVHKVGGDVEYSETLKLQYTAHNMHIPILFRGDILRNEIRTYMSSMPQTFDELAMVHDLLGYDKGLCKAACMAVAFQKATRIAVPDLDKIETFVEKEGRMGEYKAVQIAHQKNTLRKSFRQRDREGSVPKHNI